MDMKRTVIPRLHDTGMGATTQYRATFKGLYIYGSFGSAVDEGTRNDLYKR